MLKWIIILTLSSCLGKVIKIECPLDCKCEMVKQYRQISCQNKTLVGLHALIPTETQLLDLSYNQINQLEDHIFFQLNLLQLELLNVSHNKISQIHMSAFEGLNDLKTLDLSHNAMQYILSHWFRSLQSLQELYLSGNQFGRFGDEPVLKSNTLKILDLSRSGISHFGNEVFSKITSLEMLDISENHLIQLSAGVFKPLKKLMNLKVANNSFSCNKVMENLAKYCIQHDIRYADPCAKTKKLNNKFERIQSLVEPSDEKNFWIFDDSIQSVNNSIIISNCTEKTNNENQNLLMEVINLSPVLSISILFIYGIAIGILIGCTVQIKQSVKKKKQTNNQKGFVDNSSHVRNNRRPLQRSTSLFTRRNNTEICESLVLSEWNISESTPMSPRKFSTIDLHE